MTNTLRPSNHIVGYLANDEAFCPEHAAEKWPPCSPHNEVACPECSPPPYGNAVSVVMNYEDDADKYDCFQCGKSFIEEES